MDLLDSILGSMDKPPSVSEKEKESAKSRLHFLSVQSHLVGGRGCFLLHVYFLATWGTHRAKGEARQRRERTEKVAKRIQKRGR